MMRLKYAFVDGNGAPVEIGTKDYIPEGALTLPEYCRIEDYWKKQWVGGEWIDRPAIAAPTETRLESGALQLDFTGLPDGAEVRVYDADTGALLGEETANAGAASATLADPGPYDIEVDPPSPWAYVTWRITC